jgi:hypothetical protein
MRQRRDLAGGGRQVPSMLRRHRGILQPGDALEVAGAVVEDAGGAELPIQPPVSLRHHVQGVEQLSADPAGPRHRVGAWLLRWSTPGRPRQQLRGREGNAIRASVIKQLAPGSNAILYEPARGRA